MYVMNTENKVPVVVYAEMTPNPATMKYVANKLLVESERTVEYKSIAEARGSSPLAEQLFNFPFINSIFIAGNFVAITKNESISWDFVNMELREFIKDYMETGDPVITKMPEIEEAQTEENSSTPKKRI